ncbi:hypothetical protein ACFFUB_01280 [Algimonas porphyrae]|uniref:Uncharacterized protein n=1 Tax=Algimonas porphyrae TaxID=1128113 RepID=A0ABQ5UZT7_9PROT|nr:hypothetical protein [Algimonas porphyrae]GLQ20668.1 hypothetical protein GCM10007854_16230 [Algimonas porphyrae]
MISTFLDTFKPRKRSRLTNALDLFGSDRPFSGRLSRAQLRSALRPASRGARRAMTRTSAFATAHPRGIGLGVGAVAVAAIGLYAYARLQETRTDDTTARSKDTLSE